MGQKFKEATNIFLVKILLHVCKFPRTHAVMHIELVTQGMLHKLKMFIMYQRVSDNKNIALTGNTHDYPSNQRS